MIKPGLSDQEKPSNCTGYAHVAFSVGSKERLDALTNELSSARYEVVSGLRTTSDGYYESCVHPVFIGKNMMLNGIHSSAWSQTTKNIITNAIAENYRSEVALFFSENASRRKYEKQRVYDSLTYVSILENRQKWTHCIQSLFMTTDSVGMITERFKSDESFGESTDGVFPETPIQPQSSTPHLMAFYLVIEVDAMRKSLEPLRYYNTDHAFPLSI